MTAYTAYKAIIAQLDEVFAPLDETFINDMVDSAFKRKQAIKAYKNRPDVISIETSRLLIPLSEYTSTMIAIAGGKGWYNRLTNYSDKDIKDYAEKKARSTIEARNAKISKKLVEAEITAITSSEFSGESDGFNGVYKVETTKGPKTVTITTIGAGGYNIQCYHTRVLVKIK